MVDSTRIDPTFWSGLRLDVRVEEGNRNEVWQGTIAAQRVAARVSRRSILSLDWELDLIGHLADLGFRVPRVVPADDGRRHVDGVVVQQWLEGRAPESKHDWQLVGAELQRLHEATREYPQRPECCSVAELEARRRSVDADLDQMPTEVQALVTSVFAGVAHLPPAVVHGDPMAANLRIDVDQVGLLDWDESRVDVGWHDLSPLGVRVLSPTDHRRAETLSHAWEVANGWVVEPDYAQTRLDDLREMLGRPVLFLHGLAGHGGEWDAVIDQLPPNLTVMAPDLRQVGTAEDLVVDAIELLESAAAAAGIAGPAGVLGAIVVGQSMGGVIATRLAAARPDLVRALVLVEAGMEALDDDGFAGLERWLDSWPATFADRDGAAAFFGVAQPSTPRFVPADLLAQARSTLSDHRWVEWSALTMPVIVVRASSSMISDADINQMQRTRPDMTIVAIDNSGHDVHLDQPAELAAIVETA